MKLCIRNSNLFCKRTRWYALALLIISISCLCACGYQPEQKPEIRIGVIAPLSGDNSETGTSTVEGAKLAIREVNEAGGLDIGGERQKVVLFVEDNKDIPEVAVNACRKLIYQKNVVAVIGLSISRNAIRTATVCESARVPMISTGSTNPETTAGKKYVFRAIFVDDFQARILAHFAYHDLGVRKAAVLYDIASIYNRELAEVFKRVLESSGGKLVAFESYTSDENQNFSTQLLRIRDSEAELLFLPNYYYDVLLQVQQAREIGVRATFLGGDAWGQLRSEAFKKQEFEGAFFCNNWDNSIANSPSQKFIKAYRRAYEREPKGIAALTYDSFGLLFHAVQSQGLADPESIWKGLANIQNYVGVTGTISYSGSGDPAKSAVILQIKGGKSVFYKQINP